MPGSSTTPGRAGAHVYRAQSVLPSVRMTASALQRTFTSYSLPVSRPTVRNPSQEPTLASPKSRGRPHYSGTPASRSGSAMASRCCSLDALTKPTHCAKRKLESTCNNRRLASCACAI